MRARLKEIFPSPWYLGFFALYVLLYICQAILIRFSKNTEQGGYDYSTKSAVLHTEVIKLIIASGLYLRENSVGELYQSLCEHHELLVLYLIPSILYCIYNNLTYVNLSYYDPTTYYILLQFRIAVTGVVYQILFKRYLNRLQWASLLLLTFGCIAKQLENVNFHNITLHVDFGFLNGYLVLIAVQIICSCFAGVYNEYLLKGKQKDAHLMVQNICMYLDSIVCNLFVIVASEREHAPSSIFDANLATTVIVPLLLLNNALCGISTSLFIKTFNSIMKSYAAGIELLLTAILCYLFFAIPISGFTLISISIVSYATYLYATSPVVSQPTTQPEKLLCQS